MVPGTSLSSTEELGLMMVPDSSGAMPGPERPELVGLSTLVRGFLLTTACDNLSVSTERFRAALDRERAGSSKIRMGPNADRLDVVVDS